MKQIYEIEYPGIENIANNPEFYKKLFIEESAFVFKNANLSFKDQTKTHRLLGSIVGWHDFNQDHNIIEGSYKENHSHNKSINLAQSDDILVSWHVEHSYYVNPTVAATWNMKTFKTNKDNGKTYFIDTSEIFKLMKKEWQDILKNTLIKMYIREVDKTFSFNAVKPHWLMGYDVIRIPLRMNLYLDESIKFYDLNNKIINQNEFLEILKIINWIENEIKNNTDLRKIHMWDQGDLVVSDLFKLAHAVTGGFDPKDREFTGIWGWQFDPIKIPNKL